MVLLALPLVVIAVAGQSDDWSLESGVTCQGSQTTYESCRGLPSCSQCVKRDCTFNDWGMWYKGPGCSGVCKRQRTIKENNNDCGEPCTGPLIDTKECLKAHCHHNQGTDCVWGPWSQWNSARCANQDEQMDRSRAFTPAYNGGKPCKGPTKQTMPCKNSKVPVDCQWGPWSVVPCSVTCGLGRMSRVRHVAKPAQHGGTPCAATSEEFLACNTTACPDLKYNCALSPWQAWKGCDASDPFQKRRFRHVQTFARNGGLPCKGILKEFAKCNMQNNIDLVCQLSAWSVWTACDRSCDGGQKFRHRVLMNPGGPGNCAVGSFRTVAPCGQGPCHVPGADDCRLLDWEPWGRCSAECGVGIKIRTRKPTRAINDGYGCGTSLQPDNLQEAGPCQGYNCQSVPCRWSNWEDWSGCSRTCGGGTKRRTRDVDQSPVNKGAKCPAKAKLEIAGCNVMRCPKVCINAQWGVWSPWSICSVSCGKGFQSRHRDVGQEANDCGRDVGGILEEYQRCMGATHCVPPKDCEISTWSPWSSCTASCYGIHQRTRVVSQFPQGVGKLCPQVGLRMVEACNPRIGEHYPNGCNTLTPNIDCKLSDWSKWDTCSKTCGRGQRNRARHVLQINMHRGKPCNNTPGPASLSETEGCNTNPCPGGHRCVDCKMSDWSPWGACSKSGNQKRRTRNVDQLRNQCGTPCNSTNTKELAYCDSNNGVAQLYCHWNNWEQWSICPQHTCGAQTTRRHRKLTISTAKPTYDDNILFAIPGNSGHFVCTGTQVEQKACISPKKCIAACVPRDCEFNSWTMWTQASAEGLCTSTRNIKEVNNHCGMGCKGPLVRTKACQPRTKAVVDCTLSKWGMWSQCSSPVGQRYRIRTTRTMPQMGGDPCPSTALQETQPCSKAQQNSHDCRMTQWTAWGACSRSCDSGWHVRTRRIDRAAMHGGEPCKYSLEEVQACNTKSCNTNYPVDCSLQAWSDWGACTTANRQRYRKRYVARQANFGGKGCKGNTTETAGCANTATDCKLSGWAPWSACSLTCRGGTTERSRQVDSHPAYGGTSCGAHTALKQVRGCNEGKLCTMGADCVMSQWSMWGDSVCSAKCGPGQISRSRAVTKPSSGNGKPCDGDQEQTMPCINNPPCQTQDCLWSDWSIWSQCSKTCGGGEMQRTRTLEQEPQYGGKSCDASPRLELRACGTNQCANATCVDGAWDEWQPWEPCSKTCRGGLTWRVRQLRKRASDCGKPPDGYSREVGSCKGDVECFPSADCVLSHWGLWSDCSATCEGMKRRSRRVEKEGSGNGRTCDGALKQAAPCSPAIGETLPYGCPKPGSNKVDCQMSIWEAWSPCSKPCEGGQMFRSRVVEREARGGKVCHHPIEETKGCNHFRCRNPCGEAAMQCIWTSWHPWSACTKCGGTQTRTRHVDAPLGGGQNCEMGKSEEVRGCPGKCHDHFYCTWGVWAQWSECSATCGNAVRSHKRHLMLVNLPPAYGSNSTISRQRLYEDPDGGKAMLEERFQELYRHSMKEEAARTRQLIGAFVAGGVCLFALMALVWSVTRLRGNASPDHGNAPRSTKILMATDGPDALQSDME